MENENISFEAFDGAFNDPTDNQIETVEDTADNVDITTDEEKPEYTGETEDDDSAEAEEDEKPEDTTPPAEKSDAETFTLKVNKEEKTYSREEVISLAQKGADYDRVKEQLEKSRLSGADLQKQLDDQKEAMDVLAELAKESNVDIPKLLDTLRMDMLKSQGLSAEVANERLLRMKAEKENTALKATAAQSQEKETSADRAQREVADFRKAYPDVELTHELMDKLMGDVHGGKSLTEAYRAYEKAQTAAKIADLERQLAAQKQNAENKAASPGSQKDSGGRRTKSEYDDFMEAFS